MKVIKIDKFNFVLVDDEDFESMNKISWYVSNHGYAVTSHCPHKYMHRLINKTPIGFITDHINRNTLDNRKMNLRTCDKRINSINRGLQKNNTSGHKGVSWNKDMRKWETYIWNKQRKISLGFFSNIKDAAKTRKNSESIYHAA